MAKDYSIIDGLKKEVNDKIYTIFDKGYKQGFEDGYRECQIGEFNAKSHPAYQQGLKDAWECARKIGGAVHYGGLNTDTLHEIFGWDKSVLTILSTYSASEAIAKIKEYEEKQKVLKELDCEHCSRVYGTLGCCTTVSNEWVYSCEEGHREYEEKQNASKIRVGDEVEAQCYRRGYVTRVNNNTCAVTWLDNGANGVMHVNSLKKTGNFNAVIAELFKNAVQD